ncbi:hypothetical protein P5G50_05460 [Leifsonia sp. F6_8S_P_1B]|uniref:LPXTG-motif cell wall anchor domain-containing protein n=1 Tax=Leifsonia williamsii TaxID=3035919 RepID=A0ABT8K8V9_9MICO|nr:hypothetical protein [Leifsonia williamsii]MDN4613896.1 hypothetical protein [Leifsonia williamsii]
MHQPFRVPSSWRFLLSSLAALSLSLSLVPFAPGSAAQAAPAVHEAVHAAEYQPCPATGDVAACDADHDSIPDVVERVVTGSATGATGREDRDTDGIPDWVEAMACGTTACASPTRDGVGDGIPDYARQIVCGSATCSTGNGDVNANEVPKWASVVICGTVACASGHEDYDRDGISDAIELAACVTPGADLAHTGSTIALWAITSAAAGLIGAGLVLRRRWPLLSAALDAPTTA